MSASEREREREREREGETNIDGRLLSVTPRSIHTLNITSSLMGGSQRKAKLTDHLSVVVY